jgi:hypothetical protein
LNLRERRRSAGRAPEKRRASAGEAPGERRRSAGRAPDKRRRSAGRAPDKRRRRAGRGAPGANAVRIVSKAHQFVQPSRAPSVRRAPGPHGRTGPSALSPGRSDQSTWSQDPFPNTLCAEATFTSNARGKRAAAARSRDCATTSRRRSYAHPWGSSRRRWQERPPPPAPARPRPRHLLTTIPSVPNLSLPHEPDRPAPRRSL